MMQMFYKYDVSLTMTSFYKGNYPRKNHLSGPKCVTGVFMRFLSTVKSVFTIIGTDT